MLWPLCLGGVVWLCVPLFAKTFTQAYFECWNITIFSLSGGCTPDRRIWDCLLGQTRNPLLKSLGMGLNWLCIMSKTQDINVNFHFILNYAPVKIILDSFEWSWTTDSLNVFCLYNGIKFQQCSSQLIKVSPNLGVQLSSSLWTFSQTQKQLYLMFFAYIRQDKT